MSEDPSTYRFYCFYAVQNILSGDWLKADTDEGAVAEAEARGFGSKCEVWQGTRLVASLEAVRPPA